MKSRLARDIGVVAATRFYRHTLANVTARLARDPRWRTLLAVSPDRSINAPFWPDGAALIAQGPGDLGARMQRVFDCLPPGPAIIIGSDIPQLRTGHIADAFGYLRGNDAVFGPADDGGYWLVGLRRSPRVRNIFANVRWSSADALSDTLANLKGARIALARTLSDVDNGESYRRLGSAGSSIVLPYRSS